MESSENLAPWGRVQDGDANIVVSCPQDISQFSGKPDLFPVVRDVPSIEPSNFGPRLEASRGQLEDCYYE